MASDPQEPPAAVEVPGYAFYRQSGEEEFIVYVRSGSGTYVPHESTRTKPDAKRLARKLDGRLSRAAARSKT